MNTLTLDPADTAVADAVKDCAVGDEKTITVTGKVTAMGDTFTMDVTSAGYEEEEAEVEEGVVPVKSGKANPGLVVLIGKGK